MTMRILGGLFFVMVAYGEWHGFRGPGGNGVAVGNGFPAEWSPEKNFVWKTAIPGRGHSSPVVVGNRVFLTTSIEGERVPGHKAVKHVIEGEVFVHPQMAAEDVKLTLKGLCVDAGTGKVLWERTVFEGLPYDSRHQFNTYASPTPLTDGKRVFFHFEAQGLYAFDVEGKALWKHSFGGVAKTNLGAGTSPVLAGGVMVVVVDEDEGKNSFVYGLDPATGKVVWQKKRTASATWSTPVVVKAGGRELVVATAMENTVAYDGKTGEEVWTAKGLEAYSAASPVSHGGLVFANGYHPVKKVLALRADPGAKERVAWSFDRGTAYMPSPIAYEGYLYLMASNGALTCLEAETGKLVYEGKRVPRPGRFTASPVAFDGKIILTNEDGDSYVIRAGREHEVLGTNSVGEPVYASFAFADNAIFVRGREHLFRIQRRP